MAKLDPKEKVRRAAIRKAKSDEKKRIYAEGVAQRKVQRAIKALAKTTALETKRHANQLAVELTRQKRRAIVHRMVLAAYVPGMDAEELKMAGRKIGTLIFELSFRFMGWKSAAYLTTKAEKKQAGEAFQPTHEHIYPRQFDGEFLMCHMITMGDLSFDLFCDYMDVFCQTAHVLNNENKTLEKYQKADIFISPETAYDAAGIKVEQASGNYTFYRLEEVAPPEVLCSFFGRRSCL